MVADTPGGLRGVLDLIDRLPATSSIGHTAGAVLLNVGMDFEPIKTQLVEMNVFTTILKFIDADLVEDYNMIVGIAARLCTYLVETENGLIVFKTVLDVTDRFIKLLQYFMADESRRRGCFTAIMELLVAVSQDGDKLQRAVVTSGVFEQTIAYLDGPVWKEEDDTDDDEPGQATVAKRAVIAIVVHVTGCDANLAHLFASEQFIATLLRWMAQNDEDLLVCSCLCFGNLARTDANCLQLIQQPNFVESLMTQLGKASIVVKGRPDVRSQHAIAALLKNLSLPPANKDIIGSHVGIYGVLLPLLTTMFAPVLMTGIGVLKNLVNGNVDNTRRLVSEPGAMEAVLNVAEKNEQEAIKSEATRIIVYVVKNAYRQEETLLQEVLEPFKLSVCICQLLSTTRFAVLQAECVLALILLLNSTKGPETVDQMMEQDCLKAVLTLLKQDSVQMEHKINVCSLLTLLNLKSGDHKPAITTAIHDALSDWTPPQQLAESVQHVQSTLR